MIILESPLRKDSINFFRKLKFSVSQINNETYVSDRGVLIKLNPDEKSQPGIIVFSENIRNIIEKLSAITEVVPVEKGFEFIDPSGTRVTLIETGKKIEAQENTVSSLAGKFAGVSLGLTSPAASIELWEIMDFKIVAGSLDHGWAVLVDSSASAVSILNINTCPHKFFNPSLSYFNGDNNMKIIEGIRKAGIDIEQEVTAFNDKGIVDNIILREPGGIGFFIFND